VSPAGVDPWYFPSPDTYSSLLLEQGLVVDSMDIFQRPTELPTGIREWLESVARPFLWAVSPDARRSFIDEVEAELAPVLRGADGSWHADYVRLRVCAVKGRVG
jgi:trans-aconitate methyltransferase